MSTKTESFDTSYETKIFDLMNNMREKGKNPPSKVSEIETLPFENYERLISEIASGNFMIQRFSFEYIPEVKEILSSQFENTRQSIYLVLSLSIPVISIILGYIYSWWFLICAVTPIFLFKKTKTDYNTAIFRAALRSEIAFCFLYYIGQISVTSSDYETSYFWNSEESN